MTITPSNTTHPIVAYTFTSTNAKNLGVDILALTDPTGSAQGAGLSGMCMWFSIQNQSGDFILILPSAASTKGYKVLDGDEYNPPADQNGNSYDVFEYWVKPNTGSGDIVVQRKIK